MRLIVLPKLGQLANFQKFTALEHFLCTATHDLLIPHPRVLHSLSLTMPFPTL